MTETTDQRSPEEIERDIRATQADMSRTVEQIEGELSPRNVLDALLDKAGQNGVDSGFLIDAARRNPLALGMIAIGGLWLVSDADARPSALKLPTGHSNGKDSWHPEHRSYVDHMSRCERRQGEDEESYRRRRDHSRASYFMMEQNHEEDESSFRKRLDQATEKMRQRGEQISDRTHAFAEQSRERSREIMDDAKGFYSDNPLLGGLAAAFVGAVAGSAIPATRLEEEYASALGEQALDAASAGARQAGDKVRHRKDDMLDQIDEKVGDSSQNVQQDSPGQQNAGEGSNEWPTRSVGDEA